MKYCSVCDYPFDECECLRFGLSPSELEQKKLIIKKHKKKKIEPTH